MSAPVISRRCACSRPATHRIKGGYTSYRNWSTTGVTVVGHPVEHRSLCLVCVTAYQRAYGGRVYRWRRVTFPVPVVVGEGAPRD